MLVNSEGGEAIFRNENGDTIIVPRNRRNEAMKYLLKDDHHSLDKLALDLPKAEHYASGGTVIPEDPIEGIMGPETTITAPRPEKSIGNFFKRWGYENSKGGSESLLGAIGSGIGAALQLPQAAVTYMLDPKGNVLPSKALQGTQIQKDIEMSAAQGNIGAKILKRPIVQDMLLDPLLLTSEIAKGVSKGSELINGLKKSELINNLGNKYLPNVYKLNPLAFKPNPEAYYRGIGRSGLDDAMESSVLRTANKTGNYGEDLYMTPDFKIAKGNYSIDQPTYKGDPFGEADDWEKILPKDSRSYIAEIPKTSLTNARGMGTPIVVNEGSIPLDNIKLLKQDWLRGYKEVPKSKFKSEIDWSKWNKEIPENKALIQSSNELPPIPNQLFIDDVSTINLSRGSSKGKKQIFKKTETTNENGLDIKTRYRGDEKIPSDITVEGKSGYWQLRPNKSAGENTWYFSANMDNPLESGKAMLKINEKFPFPKPVILEPNNLSLDSYNNLLNMGKRKDWTSTFENYIPLNYSSKNSKILKDLNIENTPNTNIFKTKKEADEVVNRVNKFLSEKGVTHPARIFENKVTNTFGVEIPNFKLQRQYQNGGIIGNNGMFDMTNPNIFKGLAPTIIAGALANKNKN